MNLNQPRADNIVLETGSYRASLRNNALVIALLVLGLVLAWSLPALPGTRGIAGYLPVHALLETITIVIAAMVFAVSWNAYSAKLLGNLILLGCAFLGVALLDFSHTISFAGMPDFVTPSGMDKAIDFWLAARFLAATALLIIATVPQRPFSSVVTRYVQLTTILTITAVIHWLILFHHNMLPTVFVLGKGTTAFKIYSEYVLIAINITTGFVFWMRMHRPQTFNAAALSGAAFTMALSEYFFTLYADVSDIYNLLGHIYKAVAYLLIYRAIFVALIETPFHRLSESQNHLQATLDALPDILFEFDLDGRVHGSNSEHNDLPPKAIEFITGKTVQDMFPPDGAEIVMSAIREAHEVGRSVGKLYALQLPQGERWFELSVAIKAINAGLSPRFIVLMRDITERMQMVDTLADTKRLLKTIIDTAPMRIFWKDKELRYMGCNPAFARDAGEACPENLVGKDDYQLGWKKQAELYRADDRRVMDSGVPKLSYDEPQTTPDGKTIWLRTSKVPLFGTAYEPLGVLGIYEDITERKQTEIALIRSEDNLSRAQAIAQVGSWYLNISNNQLEWSEEAFRIFGILSKKTVDLDTFISVIHPDDRERVLKSWNEAIAGATYDIEHRVVANGEIRWVRERAEIERDSNGRALTGIGTVQEITERKRTEERIHLLAFFDQLTGLPNRALFTDRIKSVLSMAKRSHSQLAILFLDLDHFKNVNDSLGHRIGDELLIQVAKRLKSIVRDEDTVSRQGGDEFVLLLPNSDAEGAAHVAKKVLEAVAQSYQVEQYELNVTSSIGIAMYPEDGADFESLNKCVDVAMYRAKQDGRNNYRFFTQEMQTNLTRTLQVENALRHVLELDQLRLHYQPQVSLQDGRIIGAEALLRWQHPELGTVPPDEFIPIAETSGQILQIGEWVLRTAVRQLKFWMDSGMDPMIIAVNLSAVQFRHPHLPTLVTQILEEAKLPTQYLELELTEGASMDDPLGAIAIMDDLHARGIRMSIDDFGTGYSSLSYLKRFKIYKLKIDQSFVRDITTDPEDKALVAAIISMANSLGMETIAEGVETAGQLAWLRNQGCNEVQGYYFSKPLPADQFEEYTKSHSTV